jgi:hypothetical protein
VVLIAGEAPAPRLRAPVDFMIVFLSVYPYVEFER